MNCSIILRVQQNTYGNTLAFRESEQGKDVSGHKKCQENKLTQRVLYAAMSAKNVISMVKRKRPTAVINKQTNKELTWYPSWKKAANIRGFARSNKKRVFIHRKLK